MFDRIFNNKKGSEREKELADLRSQLKQLEQAQVVQQAKDKALQALAPRMDDANGPLMVTGGGTFTSQISGQMALRNPDGTITYPGGAISGTGMMPVGTSWVGTTGGWYPNIFNYTSDDYTISAVNPTPYDYMTGVLRTQIDRYRVRKGRRSITVSGIPSRGGLEGPRMITHGVSFGG